MIPFGLEGGASVRTSYLTVLLAGLFILIGCPAGDDDDVSGDDDSAMPDDDTGDDDVTGDDDTTGDDDSAMPDDDTGDDDTGSADDELLGRIQVLEVYEQNHVESTGTTSTWGPKNTPWDDGIVGEWIISCGNQTGDTGVWWITQTVGDCILAVKRVCSGDCTPPCDFDEYCDNTDTCAAAPYFADAGTLTIDGLTTPLSLEPSGGNYPTSYGLPEDLFADGDPITLTASGGVHPSFTAAATGVEPLATTLPCTDIPPAGQDLTITWTPSTSPGARVRWEMTQDVHLNQGPRLRCETGDTGSLTVPAQLIDAYLYGMKHFLTLTRYTDDVVTVPGAGQIPFEVGSAVTCIINEEHTPW